MMEKRKQEEQNKKNIQRDDNSNPGTGGNTAYKGAVMVDFNVPGHTAYKNNNWYVRNPGYTCPAGSNGTVTMVVKVNQAGNVTSATYDASQSAGANSCMIEKAKKYAMMSRFNYAASAASSQTGRITYKFVTK